MNRSPGVQASPNPPAGRVVSMDDKRTPTDRSLAAEIRSIARGIVRWCTPNVLPGLDLDLAADDLSISYAPAGSMLEHSAWFAAVERLVADVQGVERAFIVPDGSTGANRIVARALDRHAGAGVVLVDRQAHHSVIRSLNMVKVPWRFIDTGTWDDRFEGPRPLRPADVAHAIQRAGEVAAVWVVTPTYGGEVADLGGIRQVVDRLAPGAILAADEAWGSHLAFHRDLAPLRASRFAHLVSQSVHKAAGAIQPAAILLWHPGAIEFDTVNDAYLDDTSTSASFLVAASIDHAYRRLSVDGGEIIGRSIGLASRLAAGLRSEIPGIVLLADERGAEGVPQDPTKVTMALPSGPVTGYAVRDILAKKRIVVEKATPATVTFLTTFGLDEAQVDATVSAAAAAVAALTAAGGAARRRVPDPFATTPAAPEIAPWDAQRAKRHASVEIAMDDAIGRIAVEQVEAYPPGVAVIAEGFRIERAAVEWLRAVRDAGGSIIGRPELDAIRVLVTD